MARYTVNFDYGDGDGIRGYRIIDTLTNTIVDKAPNEADAIDICDYYNDLENPSSLFEIPEHQDDIEW